MRCVLGMILAAFPLGLLALSHTDIELAATVKDATPFETALLKETALLALPHHKHHHHHKKHNATVPEIKVGVTPSDPAPMNLLHKIKKTENELAVKLSHEKSGRGQIEVSGPLPADFSDRFAKEVAKATGCKPEDIKVLSTSELKGQDGVDEITFEAPQDIILAVQEQAADPESKLATGPMRIFLVEKADAEDAEPADEETSSGHGKHHHEGGKKGEKKHDEDKDEKNEEKDGKKHGGHHKPPAGLKPLPDEEEEQTSEEKALARQVEDDDEAAEEQNPVQSKGIDVDTSMPYGDLEPFGREDTAQELTRNAIGESDEMVDQLERAEVAEEKRSVFRALTRLRGAAITSFDGVARAQTGNIDSYARTNHWRSTHPVRHLAQEESDVEKWAFPENCD